METKERNTYRSRLTDLIDDATYSRFDKRKSALYYGQYLGEGKRAEIKAQAREKVTERIKENKPGYGLKDVSLQSAARSVYYEHGHEDTCIGPNLPNVGLRSWTVLSGTLLTPEILGVAKYDGTPKEAAKVVKRAAKNFGAFRVGITGLDRRHVYEYDCEGTL